MFHCSRLAGSINENESIVQCNFVGCYTRITRDKLLCVPDGTPVPLTPECLHSFRVCQHSLTDLCVVVVKPSYQPVDLGGDSSDASGHRS